MSLIEIVAVFFGVLYVPLAIKGNKWCWVAGIISAALYIAFDLKLNYYQDAILQTYYVLAGGYGWYLWTLKTTDEPLTVNSWPVTRLLPFFVGGLILFPLMGFVFSKFGNAFSYLDAFTTVFSFIATYFTAKKVIESWWMWMVLNMFFIVQYFLKGAYLTSGLYLFLGVMSVVGYIEWHKQINNNHVITL